MQYLRVINMPRGARARGGRAAAIIHCHRPWCVESMRLRNLARSDDVIGRCPTSISVLSYRSTTGYDDIMWAA